MNLFNLFKRQQSLKTPVPVPVTSEELDQFMAKIISAYSLPDTDDTRDTICQLLMHLNPAVAEVPYQYFADSVNQARCKAAAYPKLEEYAAKRKAAREAKAKEQESAKQLTLVPKTEDSNG